jgi:3-dehydroshikimate dehydratase
MIRLSAFADEISPDLDEQIVTLKIENIHFLDLRGMWDINVLDLSDEQVARIKQALDAQNIQVAAIASPIGKVSIDTPLDEQIRRLDRAIELAQLFQTSYIRMFSFYPSAQNDAYTTADTAWRDEVIACLRAFTARASAAGITLVHENDGGTYGESIAHCVDVLQSVADPHLRAVFDPANFIQCHQEPYPDAYGLLHSWLGYVHVKDALADGKVVAAGEGIARWPDLLRRLRADGYDGFFSLEPHLIAMGQYGGFSGPDLFRRASQAFQRLLREMDWAYA